VLSPNAVALVVFNTTAIGSSRERLQLLVLLLTAVPYYAVVRHHVLCAHTPCPPSDRSTTGLLDIAYDPTNRHQPKPNLTTSNSMGMPLANSTEANTAAPRDSVPVSCSVTLFTKLQQHTCGRGDEPIKRRGTRAA
jgi:hypothetical protein